MPMKTIIICIAPVIVSLFAMFIALCFDASDRAVVAIGSAIGALAFVFCDRLDNSLHKRMERTTHANDSHDVRNVA